MKRAFTMAFIVLFALLLPAAADEDSLQGFTRTSSPVERDWETKFRAIPSPDNERENMRRLSAYAPPRRLALRQGQRRVDSRPIQILGLGRAHREFQRPFPHAQRTPPRTGRAHEIHCEAARAAPSPSIPLRASRAEQLPTYNAYSTDGDVTAPLVYVNYGVPEDYDQLDRLGVSVEGRHRHRPLRRLVARHQAEGRGRARRRRLHHLFRSARRRLLARRCFPEGPDAPADGVQRGSVMDFPSYSPGDPLTPGVGATPDAKRLPIKDAHRHHEDSRLCRSPTAMPSRYSPRSQDPWRPRAGAALSRFLITWARVPRKSIWS